jgi:hypothetical protein
LLQAMVTFCLPLKYRNHKMPLNFVTIINSWQWLQIIVVEWNFKEHNIYWKQSMNITFCWCIYDHFHKRLFPSV